MIFSTTLVLTCFHLQLLDSKHKKLQSLEARHQKEKTETEERLSQEEEAVLALREEMDGKDELLGKLRISTKEVSKQYWTFNIKMEHCVEHYLLRG